MTFCEVLSEKMAIAVNFVDSLTAADGLKGVISIEVTVAAVTVSVADPEIPWNVQVIVVVPAARALALPPMPPPGPMPPPVVMPATLAVEDVQVHCPVMFAEVLSEKMAVAVYGTVAPTATLAFTGLTEIDTSVADFTVTGVDPTMPPNVAVTVVVPTARALSWLACGPPPWNWPTVVSEEAHLACIVSCLEVLLL